MQPNESIIYFLSTKGRIKIGITKKLAQRAAELQRQNGPDLSLLGSISGTRAQEQYLHSLVERHRIHGEWFTDCPEVRTLVESVLRDGAPEAPVSKTAKLKKPFVPGPPRKFHLMFSDLVALMWPHDGLRRLSEFAEQPEDVCAGWLSGETDMPRLLRMAFASELLTWMTENKVRAK